MYIICVYDVDAKRCTKLMKLLRRYLFHVQNSVFEGELTPAKYKELRLKVESIIKDNDSVKFYYCYNNKQMYSSVLGETRNISNIIK